MMSAETETLMKKLLLFALLTLAPSALAQTADSSPRKQVGFTVGTLPTASSWTNTTALVTDGASAGDCITGGGSTRVMCVSNGSAWAAVAGGSSPVRNIHDMGAGSVSGGTRTLIYNGDGTMTAVCGNNSANDSHFIPTVYPGCYLLWFEDGTSNATKGIVIEDQVPNFTPSAVHLILKWTDNTFAGTYQWKAAYAVAASGTTYNPPTFSTPQNFPSQATTAGDLYVQSLTLTGVSFVAGSDVQIAIGRVDSANYTHLFQVVVEYVP
jgi:hypothetical protein